MRTIETDIAVVALGPAGLAAAIQAAEEGQQVVAFEKAAIAGGTANIAVGPFGVETDETNLRVGDVVQLQNADGAYYHTLLVSGFDAAGGILVAAHSNDAYDRPLSTYTYAAARFLQVSGVRVELDVSTGSCFYDLIGGIAIRA